MIEQEPAPAETSKPVPAAPVRQVFSPGVLALGVCMLALVAAAWVSTTVFDRLPHLEDDVAFLFQAKTLASGQIVADAPPAPKFFFIPFVIVRDGMWFGKYPPGYPAVLALGVLAGQPWLLNPLVGAASVGLVYLAGRRLYGAATGLLAAALLAASPFFLLQAGSMLSHVVCLFWALAYLLLFETARRRRSPLIAAAAGAMLGMLVLSRPLTAVGVGMPYVLWAAVDIARERRYLWRYLAMTAGFLPFVALLLGYNRLTTGDPLRFAYEFWWPYDRVGFGPGVGPGDGGHTIQSGLLNTRHNLETLQAYLFGWPDHHSLVPALLAVGFALASVSWRTLAAVIRRVQQRRAGGMSSAVDGDAGWPEAWDLLLFGVAAGLVLVHVAYWTPGEMYGPRYYFEAIGALVLLSARGILQSAGLLETVLHHLPLPRRRLRIWSHLPVLLLVAGLSTYGLVVFGQQEFHAYTDWYGINRDGVRRVEAAGLENAVVFVRMEEWTDYAPFFTQNTPTLDSDVVYAIDRGMLRNLELMDLYPGRSFYWYANDDLTPLTPEISGSGD